MSTKQNNITNIISFMDLISPESGLIETCLIDYERFLNINLLEKARESILKLKLAAEEAKLKNGVRVLDEEYKILDLACSEQLELNTKDIDIILRANDIFVVMLEFEADEIEEMFQSEEVIINEYIKSLKKISIPSRIKKYSPKKKAEEIKSQQAAQAIVREDSKPEEEIKKEKETEQIRLLLSSSSEIIADKLSDREINSEDVQIIIEESKSIAATANNAGYQKVFELGRAMQELFVAYSEGIINISEGQIGKLRQAIHFLKSIPLENYQTLLDKLSEQSLEIDTYIDSMKEFIDDAVSGIDISFATHNLIKPEHKSSKIKPPENLFSFNELIDNINQLYSVNNSHKLNSLKLSKIKSGLRELQFMANSTIFNLAETDSKALEILKNTSEKILSMISEIDEISIEHNASIKKSSDSLKRSHRMLYNLRSYSFADIIAGIDELVLEIAEYSSRKVKLEIIGADVRIGAESAAKIEKLLPELLRNVIINQIESPDERINIGKKPYAKLKISAVQNSGQLKIILSDDGYGKNASILAEQYAEHIDNIRKAGIGLEFESKHNQKCKIILTLADKYSIQHVLIFNLASEYFAIDISEIDSIIDIKNNISDYKEIYTIIPNELFSKKETNKALSQAAIIKREDKQYAICFESFMTEAELSSKPKQAFMKRNPFIIYSGTFNDKLAHVLDISKIIRDHNKNQS